MDNKTHKNLSNQARPFKTMTAKSPLVLSFLLLTILSGCGGGSDSQSKPTPPDTNSGRLTYTGDPARDTYAANYQSAVWENLRLLDRCGGCHSKKPKNKPNAVTTPQAPHFTDQDDVNYAFDQAFGNNLINLDNPKQSRLYTKVLAGHNCWESTAQDCANLIETYISRMINESKGGLDRKLVISAPELRDPGTSKPIPANRPAEYKSGLHNLLTTYCASCHAESASNPQAPYFADSDLDKSYDAVKSKIDVNDPNNSRLVIRLGREFHNCWSNCRSNAQEMSDAIAAIAKNIEVDSFKVDVYTSKALRLNEGAIIEKGSRHEDNQIAFYEFKSGKGDTILDTSGIQPEVHLTLNGTEGMDYNWVSGWGIEFNTAKGRAQSTTAASRKLYDLIKLTDEYSIEAWVFPANTTQENAHIISYSSGTDPRNFTLSQNMYNYDFLHRSSTTNVNGEPALSTADADEDLQATLQHVVITYDRFNKRRIYVNGVFTGDVDEVEGGHLRDWDDTFAFILGNEVSQQYTWQGKLRLVAVHNRALTQQQIQQNFDFGVGQNFLLLFGIDDILEGKDSEKAENFIMFEVAAFDNYSYLFSKPSYINLNPELNGADSPKPAVKELEYMRLGINSKHSDTGQAYRNLKATIGGPSYSPEGQQISALGTIIPLEKGPEEDEFFLTFEKLGDGEVKRVADPALGAIPALPVVTDETKTPDIGIRTFEEILTTMSRMTGVERTHVTLSNVDEATPANNGIYTNYRQQLPTTENPISFANSQQMAIAQLALAYCNILVDRDVLNPTPSNRYFTNFDFSANASAAFDDVNQKRIVDALLMNMLNAGDVTPEADVDENIILNLTTQPSNPDIRTELDLLINGEIIKMVKTRTGLLDVCKAPAAPASCANGTRTKQIVKAACASVLGSAVMLVQ